MARVGQILVSKKGVSYIKINDNLKEDLVLKAGDALFLSNPVDDINALVERGIITAQEGDEKRGKVPSFVKKNISIAKK